MATFSASILPLLFIARISGLFVASLVILWALAFRSSFLPRSSSQEDLIYAVLHPLLMVIGFIIISGEAILVHRWLPGSRSFKKSVHLCLQGVALASGIFGIWTKFHGQDGVVANFYSLHSWMGLICVTMFGAQGIIHLLKNQPIKQSNGPRECPKRKQRRGLWLFANHKAWIFMYKWIVGFLSFWHRGEVRASRIGVLPWHIFLGLYTYGLAVATAETGLLEKLTFLQSRRSISKRCPESMVVNSLGLGLALLCGIVIFTAISPKFHARQTKLNHSNSSSFLLDERTEIDRSR